MSSESFRTKAVRDSAQIVAKQMIQEPVKEAVREAIREEAVAVDERERERVVSQQSHSDDSSGGRSRLFWGGLVAAIVGVTVLARRRMGSQSESWSGSSTDIATDQSEGGYSTEGEMQTSEGTGESDEVSHSTTSDQ